MGGIPNTIDGLKKINDARVKELAGLKYGQYCQTCGSVRNLEAGHLLHRNKKSVRWDIRNVFLQCHTCNGYHEQNPEPLRRAFLKFYTEDDYQQLIQDSNKLVKVTKSYLQGVLYELNESILEETLKLGK